MRITITQIDSDLASSGVDVYVQGSHIGQIGRGGTTSTDIPATDRCEVVIVCGSFKERMAITGDANIQVSWALGPPPRMIVTRKK